MSATEPLCHLIGVSSSYLSRKENLILEIELFIRIYEELKEYYRRQNREYFSLMKFTTEMENIMLEDNFIRFLLKDILTSGEYTIQGVALYANIHEDVVIETATGCNKSPSAQLLRKILELHRTVKREMYNKIVKKIILEHSAMA